MATLAKLALCIYGNESVFSILFSVTLNTFHQAVLFSSEPLMHRLVALMKKQFHVVSAHIAGGFDALRQACGFAVSGDLRIPITHNYHGQR